VSYVSRQILACEWMVDICLMMEDSFFLLGSATGTWPMTTYVTSKHTCTHIHTQSQSQSHTHMHTHTLAMLLRCRYSSRYQCTLHWISNDNLVYRIWTQFSIEVSVKPMRRSHFELLENNMPQNVPRASCKINCLLEGSDWSIPMKVAQIVVKKSAAGHVSSMHR
jgi:hypothetical protein